MFKEFLEKDLKAIFEKERVDFSNALSHFGSELGVLFAIIDQDGVKNNFRDGENYFSIMGTLEFMDDATQTSFGYFSQRMALSKYEAAGNLKLIGRESSESLNNADSDRLLVRKSQKFSYRISIPYNKPLGNIESLELQAEME